MRFGKIGWGVRVGAAYFLEPSEPAQRRYEAMRAYFVDGLTASEVATRFGYSPASVHQMASELRRQRAVLPFLQARAAIGAQGRPCA
jgi:transposase-like protein